ncbi:MAG: SGNH/GDSL hydrolase family protein [Lachnospiraceae bacterium]
MGKRILFIGDSITDGNRYKEEKDRGDLNHQMGHSYAYVVNAILGSNAPEKGYEFLNRGISGNRVIDLYGRVYEDLILLKPDVVSILVGVNDGPQAEHGYQATGAVKFETLYRMLLEEIRAALPEVSLVICEPFIGQSGTALDERYEEWENCIKEYRIKAGALAEEFNAVFVPLQENFHKACKHRDSSYWIWDGIHPTENGHELIARQWIQHTKHLFGGNEDEIYEV